MRLDPVAEFATADAIVAAARSLRARGLLHLEAYTPYPISELQELLDERRPTIPRWVLLAGLLGGALAFLFQWWANGWNYPINVGGRPLFSAPAFIPITFEGAVLGASLTAFLGWLASCGLPRLVHPVFSIPRFERASIDRFFLRIASDQAGYEAEAVDRILADCGALQVTFAAGSRR